MMLKLYQDQSAREPLSLLKKPLPLLLMDVNVLLPYKSAHFLWLLQFSSDSNKWRDWKKHGPSRHFEKQHFLQACSSASFSLPRLFLPNLLLLQSCLSSAAGPFPETASFHLCSSHLSGDSITHCCHEGSHTTPPINSPLPPIPAVCSFWDDSSC